MNSYVHKPFKPGHYVMDNGMTISALSIDMQGALKFRDGDLAYSLQALWEVKAARETRLILERLCVGVT